jgi:NADP-dependent 3-hydroxy acid dehydrogenase YdfG
MGKNDRRQHQRSFVWYSSITIFKKQESGHFINLSSAGVKKYLPGGTVYSGTKFAVSAISEGLRHEVGGNIRTSIAPAVESELKLEAPIKKVPILLNFINQLYPQMR